ncbi:DNA-directed RNA polymerase subunit beta, partial [bacterium]|nr:DNA-directed RNA polymerase subunit beta [bacterium]
MKQSSGLIERQSFAKIPSIMSLPNLVDIQKRSYREFLQEDIPPEKRSHSGLQAVFQDIFPMASGSGRCSMEFVSYSVGRPEYSAEECQGTGRTYNAPLKLRLRLVIRRQAEEAPEKREQEVYLGELPLMTEGGSFIINGAERVVVSQLHRSPGVCFEEKIHPSGRRLCSVRIIPYRGTWLELEFDTYDVLSVVIDRRRRILVTTLLRALGYSSSQDITKLFYETETIRLGSGLHRKKFLGRFLARDVRKGGEVIGESGEEVSDHLLRQLKEAGVEKLTLVITPKDEVSIINTLRKDHCRSEEEAQLEIFRRLRPGDPPTPENARRLLHRLFFDPRTYDLARVGRYKLNRKLGLNVPLRETTLRREDMVEIIRYLLKLKKREGTVDDIDHLGSRRVRTVGESVANQFRVGLERMERFIRERMSSQDLEDLTPQNLVNPKMISSAINNFFGRSQLSQFMDQVNPLAELTHKRRLSALGPGGLSRERAGFEVRDVHFSHYGRICPIETPEGTNIGLIVSMSTYAQINDLGFLKTPYRKVRNGKATRQIEYLSADVEDDYVIAQANAKLDAEGRFTDDKIFARLRNDFPKVSPGQVQYMDVSPEQLVSVSTALIPFLEHDDANRALMGSNMQRQAVPLLWAEAPLVGTGMERPAAVDSGAMALSFQDGKVEKVSANAITIRSGSEVHEYSLKKFLRSNQDTCLNQRPVVQPGERVSRGQVIADGPGTHLGELALGRDILVAFMPWWGYNFEDAILVSEKVVKEDVYTSIHIEEFELEARDTKLGPEEITRDIPNVGEEALKDLGENGIIRIGAEVRSEDILAGKITPKGETELSPEEKLLRAIFGEKAGDVRDASLRVPPGVEGIVIDVKVFSRREGKGPRKSGGWAAAELPSGVN